MRTASALSATCALLLPAACMSCAGTTYERAAAVDPPKQGPLQVGAYSFTRLPPDRGRVVVYGDEGSVVEDADSHALRLACVATPCVDEVTPGAHRYWLVPRGGVVDVGPDGVVLSKDGVYPSPVEAVVDVADGMTVLLRASLGRTEVRRSLPPGRAIGWTLFATGLAVAVLGVVIAARAESRSVDGEMGTGLAEAGAGVLTLGGALFLSNVNDSVTVRDHPGSARQWTAP